MHEMSIVQSIISIIEEEMAKNGVTRLLRVKIIHGSMSNVVADAMEFAWQALTMDTPFASATMETEEIPLTLRCFSCKHEFTPEVNLVLAACPKCGEQLGHEILAGRELYIDAIEAE